jgi:hypothetical protein
MFLLTFLPVEGALILYICLILFLYLFLRYVCMSLLLIIFPRFNSSLLQSCFFLYLNVRWVTAICVH